MCVCVCVCVCVKPDDRPKNNIKDLRAPSGQHQGGGVVLTKEKPGLKNSGRQGERQGRGRDEEGDEEEERGGGGGGERQSSR